MLHAIVAGGALGGPVGMALAAAALGLSARSLWNSKTPQEVTVAVKNSLATPDNETRNRILFMTALMAAAIRADGSPDEKELAFLEGQLSEFSKALGGSAALERDLTDVVARDHSLEDLKARFDALTMLNDEIKESFSTIIWEAIKSDAHVYAEEKAFLYRCELMFAGLPDTEIFEYRESTPSCESGRNLRVVYRNDIKAAFPDTDRKSLVAGELYMRHPVNHQELVPISYFMQDTFACSKDSELIEAVCDAGAKHLSITILNNEHRERHSEKGGELKVGKVVGKGALSASSVAQEVANSGDSTRIEIEFAGNRPGLWRLWSGKTAAQVLERSRWLRNDPTLVAFVKTCFGQNRTQKFSAEFSYHAEAQSLEAISLAVKCKLAKTSVDAKLRFEEKSKALVNRTVVYEVSF